MFASFALSNKEPASGGETYKPKNCRQEHHCRIAIYADKRLVVLKEDGCGTVEYSAESVKR